MPDMLLPQVSSAPAPAKSVVNAARASEARPESETDQGFSSVLKSRMQPEEEAAQAETENGTAASAAAPGEPTASDAEGKTLPQSGNREDPPLAATTSQGDAGALLVAVESEALAESGAAASGIEAALVVPGLQAGVPGEMPDPALTEAAAGKRPAPPAAVGWQARGPWQSGAMELPDAAQTAVAQAVRTAVGESQEGAPVALMPERFGAEVRAVVAAAHNRAPVLESALERMTTSSPAPAPAVQTLAAPAAQDTASARPALPTTTVETYLRQPGWDQAFGERVLWVANQKFQGAEIKLNPAHLGPVEVRVQLHNDQAQISFTAQHAATREALEAALPRLREMFNASGYSQVDVNVSHHSFAEQQRHAQGFEGRFQAFAGNDDGEQAAGTQPGAGRMTSLSTNAIDLFA